MLHPFQVGKTYRNRIGEYVVQEIEGDEMTIRYTSGNTLRTRVSVQARIWENIQFEEQMAREEERRKLAQEARRAARRRTARAKKAKAMPKFRGFQDSDFEAKKRGIAWRSREELGRLLASKMSEKAEGDFGYWIVRRKSEVHVARKKHYDRDKIDRMAAFFVEVDDTGVTYGLRIGTPSGRVRASWPSQAFLALLDEDSKQRRALRSAMRTQDLTLDVYAMDVRYGQVGRIQVQDRGFLWEHETEDQEMTRKMNWKTLAEYLRTVSPGQQSTLFLRKHLDAKAALKAGDRVSDELLPVFEALLPMYDVCVGE